MPLLTTRCLAVVSLLALGVTATPAAQETVRSVIEGNNRRFAAAAAKADAAAVAELYTANAQAYPPNAEAIQGRSAIQALWKSVFDGGITNVTLTTKDVESHGDIAYETGTFEMKLKEGKTVDRGKYIVVWKRDGGAWKIHHDIWNSSMPVK